MKRSWKKGKIWAPSRRVMVAASRVFSRVRRQMSDTDASACLGCTEDANASIRNKPAGRKSLLTNWSLDRDQLPFVALFRRIFQRTVVPLRRNRFGSLFGRAIVNCVRWSIHFHGHVHFHLPRLMFPLRTQIWVTRVINMMNSSSSPSEPALFSFGGELILTARS